MSYSKVYEVLKEASEKWPQMPAIYDEFGMLTFQELFDETEFLKNKLLELGVTKGMGVGVMARNGRNFISGIFAVIGCDAVTVPISHQLKKNELDDLFFESQIHAILFDSSVVCSIENKKKNIPMKIGEFQFTFTAVLKTKLFAPHVPDAAFMRFTSGTTGKSKGVIISNRSAIERVEAANKVLQLGTTDTVIWVLPIAYHFVVSILLYVRFGSAIAIAKDFLPQNIIDITNKHKGTLLYASPMQIRLLAGNSGNLKMSTLQKVISTSSAISVETCLAFSSRFDINVSQAYGIIEIGLPIINYSKSAEEPDSVGFSLPDYEVAILDENYFPLPSNVVGKLAIKGPGMFDAYLSPPTLKSDILKNGFFLTADFATKSSEGLIKIKGREKSMINISGNKVFPEEVERVLESYENIKMARITGVPHPLMGQIIQAEIMLIETKEIDVEEVLTYCRKRLSTFKVPQKIKIVDSLPLTGSGKLLR